VRLSVAYDVAWRSIINEKRSAHGGVDYADGRGTWIIDAAPPRLHGRGDTATVAEPTEKFVVNLSAANQGLIVDSGVGTSSPTAANQHRDVAKKEGQKGPDDAVHVHGHTLGATIRQDDVVPHRGRHRQDK